LSGSFLQMSDNQKKTKRALKINQKGFLLFKKMLLPLHSRSARDSFLKSGAKKFKNKKKSFSCFEKILAVTLQSVSENNFRV
jgi:hypothetical protein